MVKQPLVSVIVTNFNGKKYLKKCFDSLLKQTYKFIELIMADDGSTDDSVAFVKKHYPEVQIAVNPKNLGLSISSNHGASLARGTYLFFYNNDTIAFPNLVAEMVKIAGKGKKTGVVCPVALPYDSKDDASMNDAQKDIGVGSDIYGYICLAKDAGHIFYPDAAIFILSDLFNKIGRFDPSFFLYGEDMDICWRVHLLGYHIVPALKARFRHDSFCAQLEGGRFKTTYKRRHLVERQVIKKLLKYYQVSTLLWLLPKFFFFYILESFFFLIFKREVKMFYSVYLQSIIWNVVNLQDTFQKRKAIQRIRKVDDAYILNLMYPKYRKLEVALKFGAPVIKN